MTILAKKLSEMSRKELTDVIIQQGAEITALKNTDIFEKELEERIKLCCALADKDAEIERLNALLAYAASTGDECAIEVEALRSRLAEAEALLRLAHAYVRGPDYDRIDAFLARKE